MSSQPAENGHDGYDIFSPGFRTDPYATWSAMRASGCPVAHSGQWGGSWMPVRYDTIREIARDVPLDRLLVETDAPYLAPVPMRGKRNEPAWVAHTAGVLAGLRGMTPEALAELTTANFRRLFPKTVSP